MVNSILENWLDTIGDATDIKGWVEEHGTDKDKEFLQYINLSYNTPRTLVTIKYKAFPNPIKTDTGISVWDDFDGRLRECRGVTIDTTTKKIALRAFDKFFEVGQMPETAIDKVQKAISDADLVEFSEKLDGSLVSMRNYKGIFTVTSMGSNESTFIEETIKPDITPEIKEMVMANPDITFIFEDLEKSNDHVVKYKDEELGLYLIGMRNMNTWYLYNYHEVIATAEKYNVRHTTIHNTNFADEVKVLAKTGGYEREGDVINIDGWRVKLKSEDYVRLHFIRTSIGINQIIKAVANGTINEIIDDLSYQNKERLDKIILFCDLVIEDALRYIETAPAEKKVFFNEYLPKIPKTLQKIVSTYYMKGYLMPPLLVQTKGDPKYISYSEITDYLESHNQKSD